MAEVSSIGVTSDAPSARVSSRRSVDWMPSALARRRTGPTPIASSTLTATTLTERARAVRTEIGPRKRDRPAFWGFQLPKTSGASLTMEAAVSFRSWKAAR